MDEHFMKHMEKLIAAVFLVGCASAQQSAETAVKAVKDCAYLADYADEISDALNAKDYTLAMNLAGNAYMKSLETVETPCLESAKDLTKQVTDFIADAANKDVITE
jgi:hypothetical protein